MSGHIIKRADERALDADNKPTMHGNKLEWNLMSGMGAASNWGLNFFSQKDIHVSGERPGSHQNTRPTSKWWQ